MKLPTITASQARLLLLGAQGLLDDPAGPATHDTLDALIHRMGFVQLDSINVVERAHHLTLGARLDAYRPPLLAHLLEERKSLFEHWTHDASAIPTAWFPFWKPRFREARWRLADHTWMKERLGPDSRKVLAAVRRRIRREGPLMSRDFERDTPGEGGGWWSWKPEKAALELLWRTGEVAIVKRDGFQKVYDLVERVLPDHHAQPHPRSTAHRDWACRTALERLGVATPREIAHFWHAVDAKEAATWCRGAVKRGEAENVLVEGRPTVAIAGWRERAAASPDAPDRMRFLSPFDPVIRDRNRALRLFGFDYRIEVFVPGPKRKFGYYVMPLLDGERLVGRAEPKFRRDTGTLEIQKVWWESGVKAKPLGKRFSAAAERLAAMIGARKVTMPR